MYLKTIDYCKAGMTDKQKLRYEIEHYVSLLSKKELRQLKTYIEEEFNLP